MEEKRKEEIEFTMELVKQLPEDRKLFFNTSTISIEVTKEEAINLLKQMLEQLKNEKKEVR